MSVQGTTTIDFGAFPGDTSASVSVSSGTIGSGNLVDAWIIAVATADHSADEHTLEPPKITAGNIAAGSGFTIYGTADPQECGHGGGHRCYGLWTVAWVWN